MGNFSEGFPLPSIGVFGTVSENLYEKPLLRLSAGEVKNLTFRAVALLKHLTTGLGS